MARPKGEGWFKALRRWLADGENPAAKFWLCERTQDGMSKLLPFSIPPGWDDELLWTRTGGLCAHAQEDANSADNGKRIYFLLALNALDEVIDRSPAVPFFSVAEAMDHEGGGAAIEGANPKGLLAQHMRFTEGLMRASFAGFRETIEAQNEQIKRYAESASAIEEKRLEMIVQYEQLLSEGHRRQLEEKKLLASERRMDELMGSLQRFTPAIMARLLPGEAVTGDSAAKALASSIKGLFDGLPQEKIMQLAELMGPEKGAGLAEIFSLVERIEQGAVEGQAHAAQ